MERIHKHTQYLILAGAYSFILLGCGGTPDKNPLLEETKTAFQKAENDTMIVKNAPVALKEAEEALARSEQSWEEGEREEIVTHQAYIAKKRVSIAREAAQLNAAQDAVSRAETERQEVLIQARRAEAEAAERRAQEALTQAQKERKKAEQARKRAEELSQRAEELSKRVSELEAQQTERGLVLTLGDVLFDFGKAQLKSGGERAVQALTNFMREYPKRNVMIEGFTDSVGSESFNQELSRRRAEAVRQALVDNGISNSRIRVRGYGEQYPVASNDTDSGRQQNRRVEVIISDKDGKIPERGQ